MTESLGAAVAMSLFILLSSVTFLVLLDVWDLQSTEAMVNADLLTDRINTRVSITSTTAGEPTCGVFTIAISNSGKTPVSDFSEMDLIADYQDSGGNRVHRRLDYVTGAVGDNQWALQSITPDTRNPNTWDPQETVIFNLKVNPNVSSSVSGSMVVSTPFGVTDSAYLGC